MITENELRISNESYTHKDFYQAYPELLDAITKMTNMWDPSSSNESDPGVVILKMMAFELDKICYNIDKTILEDFMVSVTQLDAMKRLCDMMGYNMKYYQSAATNVSFMWIGNELETQDQNELGRFIKIPQWAELTDDSGEVVYTLTEEAHLEYKGQVVTKPVIEGKCLDVTINDDNAVKLFNLDDKNRFYLPESKIAENGI